MMSLISGSASSSSSGPRPSSSSTSTFSSANCSRRLRLIFSSASTSPMIGRNSSASSSLRQRRRGFGIDAFEQARQHLFLDPVDAGFEALKLFRLHRLGRRPLIQPVHRLHFGGEDARRRVGRRRHIEGGELRPAGRAGATLHRLRHAKGGAASSTAAASECAHVSILLSTRSLRGVSQTASTGPHPIG